MEEKVFLVVSLVRDLTNNTLLVIREKSNIARARRPQDFFPSNMKSIGENEVQCAIRVTFEQTGIVIKNPKEVSRIKVEMEDKEKNYEVVVFLSTEFSGSIHPSASTDVIWLSLSTPGQHPLPGMDLSTYMVWSEEEPVKADGQIVGFVLHKILAGKYVRGVYYYSNDEFFDTEVRIL